MRCQYLVTNVDTWNRILTICRLQMNFWTEQNVSAVTGARKAELPSSGGEALLQIDFLIDLLRRLMRRGINTNLDTSAQPFTREEPFFPNLMELLKYTDLVMLDIKHIDDEEHKELTGQTKKNILDCARYLSEQGIPMWIRHVLVGILQTMVNT